MRFSFSKKERLCSSKAISALFAKGKRFSHTVKGNTLRCIYLADVDAPAYVTALMRAAASPTLDTAAPITASIAAPVVTPAATPIAAPAKILISVPKKNLKRAVDRNRIKRLIKEGYRLKKNILSSSNIRFNIAFVYQGSANIPFEDIKYMIGLFLEKILSNETRS
ncbi:MAG: ribonuclease P protein component [Bacteroidales bacterium]|jgi:ribonuclease P protein component|nr:ribonuclease P protein component [Bacteroidales bacterium]